MTDVQRIAQLEEQIRQLQTPQATSSYSYYNLPSSGEPIPQISGVVLDQVPQYTPSEEHSHSEGSQRQRRFPSGRRVLRTRIHGPRLNGQLDDRSDAVWELVHETHQMAQSILQIVMQSTESMKVLVKRVERLEHLWRSDMEKQHIDSGLYPSLEMQPPNLSEPDTQFSQVQTQAEGIRPTSNSGRHTNSMPFIQPGPLVRNPAEVSHPDFSVAQLSQPPLQAYGTQMAPSMVNQPQSFGFVDQCLRPSFPREYVASDTATHRQLVPEQQYPLERPMDEVREKMNDGYWPQLA